MSRRSTAGLLAAGLAGSILPLVGAAAPVVLPSAYAAEDAICSETVLPETEVLAGSKARTNPALDAHARARGAGGHRRQRREGRGHRQRDPAGPGDQPGRGDGVAGTAGRPPLRPRHDRRRPDLRARRRGPGRAGDRHPRLRHRRRGRVAGREGRHLPGHRRRDRGGHRAAPDHPVPGRQHRAVGRDGRPRAAAGDQGAAEARRGRGGLGGQRGPRGVGRLQGHDQQRRRGLPGRLQAACWR